MIQKRDDLSVRRQCSLLGLNRATLYYKGKEPDEAARLFRERVMARIDYWHTRMPAIGSRKIAVLLWKEVFDVGRKMIRNCMAEMGFSAIYPKANLSKRNFKQAIAPYLLRNCQITRPNQAWSVDITYIKMVHSHMFLTAVIDWYSRKIVGWHLSDTLDTDSVIIAVRKRYLYAWNTGNSKQRPRLPVHQRRVQGFPEGTGHPAEHGRQIQMG